MQNHGKVFSIKAQAIARVRLLTTLEGGREERTPRDFFGCVFCLDGEHNDCRLLLADTGPLEPGQKAEVPLVFTSPDLVIPRLRVGSRFTLWEGRHIADGEVLRVLSST